MGSLRVYLASIAILLSGCPALTGYRATVTVHVSPQPITDMRAAVLGIGGFQGPLKIEGSPSCSYYQKRLPRSGVMAQVHDCYGATNESETGWAYQVSVGNHIEGKNEIVQDEIDMLAAEIADALRKAAAENKVTIRVRRFGVPII
jgi:hypothetical protein